MKIDFLMAVNVNVTSLNTESGLRQLYEVLAVCGVGGRDGAVGEEGGEGDGGPVVEPQLLPARRHRALPHRGAARLAHVTCK